MAHVNMKQMLETGVHFGHQTRRWNPKMRPFIFGARNGIHIIDLQQTVRLFQKAHDFVADVVAEGGKVIFVGTKRQAQESVKNEATRAGQFYVTNRWMGGSLTNFQTIKKSIDRLKKLESMFEDGSVEKFPKKEIVRMNREVAKLNNALGGVKDMEALPGAAFIIDPNREDIAVRECRKLEIPIVAIVDTNCDPDLIDYIIPGNDDAIRAIKLFVSHIAEACLEGQARLKETEQVKKAEAEEAAEEEAKAAKNAKAEAEAKPETKAETVTEEVTRKEPQVDSEEE
ncbi:MAG: 30S ribosomal protein S2 [Thermodesulfobacteriota bacterium]|nr:30S ribosomal protein S2 [Thermodesulfobacteriota bacterium]